MIEHLSTRAPSQIQSFGSTNNYEGLKINTNCFDGTHSTRSDSSEAAAACQGSACFVQELSLISVMIFVDATCSPGNDKNVALVV